MSHHTKDKGDLAVTLVMVEFAKLNCSACIPMSEHLSFDIIIVSENAEIVKRIQVKHSTLHNGAIRLKLFSQYGYAGYSIRKDINLKAVDAYAIYCSNNNNFYYICSDELEDFGSKSINIRIEDSKNLQMTNVYFGECYTNPMRIFIPYKTRKSQILEQRQHIYNRYAKMYTNTTSTNTYICPVTKDELQSLLYEMTPIEIGIKYNVAQATVCRWCRKLGVTPTRKNGW